MPKFWPSGHTFLNAVHKQLPLATKMKFDGPDVSQLRKRFAKTITSQGHNMLDGLLNYSTDRRMTSDMCLKHPWFTESPLPIDPSMFPMWPAKSEKSSGSGQKTPPAPAPGANAKEADLDDKTGFSIAAAPQQRGGGFTLKF